jgi:hypothetical protein
MFFKIFLNRKRNLGGRETVMLVITRILNGIRSGQHVTGCGGDILALPKGA